VAKRINDASDAMKRLLKQSGSVENYDVARAAQTQLAKALTVPLREGVLNGDIVTDIYEPIRFEPGQSVEFPLDFLVPGTEKDFVAYAMPATGRIPERYVEGDFVMVPTYEVTNSIDFAMKYLRDSRWDVVKRALEVLEAGFVRKMNQDGWRTLLSAAVNRSLSVYDDLATAGLFTKRLVVLMKNVMRRQAGGNSTSLNRGKLSRLYISPESIEDTRSWTLTDADDTTRREIYQSEEWGLTKLFGVELRDLDELGVGQEYQNYIATTLGYSLPGSPTKTEFVVGLDMTKSDSFVMPVREEVRVFEDPNFHRARRAGFYGWAEHGFAVLDSRRVLLGAL
jgi:hypothetical protein